MQRSLYPGAGVMVERDQDRFYIQRQDGSFTCLTVYEMTEQLAKFLNDLQIDIEVEQRVRLSAK